MPRVATILMVDRNARNRELLTHLLRRHGYRALDVGDLDDLDPVLERESIDLVLVDLSGYGRGIWAYCERMQDNGIPFLVISPRSGSAIQKESYSRGAHGFLVKPLGANDLMQLIRNMLHE